MHRNAPVADDVRRALLAHDWPGNVRELRNALEHHDGNISRAAEALGLHRQSLQRLLRSAGLRKPECG